MELGPNEDAKQREFTLGGGLLGPSTKPASVFSHEKVNTNADAQTWTCDICNITVGRQYRAAHNSGMWHISQAKKPHWTCLICNITINASMQADHEVERVHCQNRDKIRSGFSLEEAKEWKCTLCNITIDLASRSSHHYSQVHQMAMIKNQPKPNKRKKKGKSSRAAKAAKTWTCTACNVTMDAASKLSHEAKISHRKAAGMPYPCEVCGIYITIRFRASHEATRIHAAAAISGKATGESPPTPASASYQRITAARASPPAAAPPKTKPSRRIPHHETFDLALALKAQEFFEAEKLNREPMWTCNICDVTIHTEDRHEHENSRDHLKNRRKEKKAAKRWTCMMCDVVVPGDMREAHESSRQHRVRLHDPEAKAE